MNGIISKPMIKLAGCNTLWTLSGKSGIELKSRDDGCFTSNTGLLVSNTQKQYGCVHQVQYTVKNTSNDTVKIEHISSGCFESIGGGLLPWYDDRKYKLHICHFTWQGEAQWRESSLSDLGLYKASNHGDVNAIQLRSVGNQSTALYFPQIFIEDMELNVIYFFELETTSNWYIEISGNPDGTLRVELNSAFFNNDNWFLNLEGGKEYTASPCVYGVTDGGFEEAAAALTDYRRSTSKASLSVMPACFNDYMNCLWAMPETHKLIPLIDKAAEVGCEVFCIDAGWQKKPNTKDMDLGDWIWRDERFPEYGFKGIIDYIKNKGMLPGVWLELNSIHSSCDAYKKFSDYLLKRNGVYTGSAYRYQIDFREPAVTEYMSEVIDRLYCAGVRFIKNDYNQTSGIAFDGDLCGGEEVRDNSIAFDKFIDDIREKYPDLIIENCASGAMRCDNSIMRHFHLESISDQEYYYNNPSILSGIAACLPPEKCGSWAYPYPQLFDDRLKPAAEAVKINSDDNANETVFNMVNGILGLLYLSGHIEFADSENTRLISEAIKIYKDNRAFIASSYPIYPVGRIKIETDGFYAYGLTNKDKSKILLGIWRINSHENVQVFDLSKYVHGDSTIKLVYPQNYDTDFSFSNGKLSIKLDAPYSARLFEISNKLN